MKKFLFTPIVAMLLLSSCARFYPMPVGGNVAYIDYGYYSSYTSHDGDISIWIKFNEKTKRDIGFEVHIENRSDRAIAINPADFYYLVDTRTVQYFALTPDAKLNNVDRLIDSKWTAINAAKALSYVASAAYLAAVVVHEDEISEEQEAAYQSALATHADYEPWEIETMVALHEYKDFVDMALLRAQILPANSQCSGLVYFPKMDLKKANRLALRLNLDGEQADFNFSL